VCPASERADVERVGSQHVALVFGERSPEAGIEVSMGSRGDAYDTPRWSFFKRSRAELLHRQSSRTKPELGTAVFE
jgi:hypothetical protein